MAEVVGIVLAVGFVLYWILKALVALGWIYVHSRDEGGGTMP
jgi:hypothetical protein